MADQKQILVAFLAVRPTQDGEGYLGGLLVTDETGIPQEFRCTHPLRPTAPQKALYGDTLKPHIFNQLVGLPLIRASTTSPVFCCVEEPILLQLGDDVNLPVVHLQRLGEVLAVDAPQANGLKSPQKPRRIDSERVGFQPISANFGHGHEPDLETILDDLQRVFNQIDLLEPFDRITTAINTLVERDDRFR